MGVGERLRPDVGRPIRWRVTGQEKSLEAEVRSSGEVKRGGDFGHTQQEPLVIIPGHVRILVSGLGGLLEVFDAVCNKGLAPIPA